LNQKSKLFFSQINYQFFSRMPITDDNTILSEKYGLTNLLAGIILPIGDQFILRLTYRMNNVFDTKYASMLLINARSFGTSEPRYYYPGLPRNHQVSLRVNYKL